MREVEIKGTDTIIGFPDDFDDDQIIQELQKVVPTSVSDQLTKDPDYATTYEPTLAEKAKQKIADFLVDNGIVSNRMAAQDIGDNLATLLEFAPGTGDIAAGDEFGRAVKQGDVVGMGFGAMAAVPIIGKAGKKTIETLYHGSPKAFQKFDPARVGDRMTSLGFGHYLTPKKEMAEQYGENVMAFDVDTSNFLNWDNLGENREIVETELLKSVPKERIAHFGKNKFEVLPSGKEGHERYKQLKEKTKDAYNDYAKARVLTDDEIEKYHPGLLETLGPDDNVVGWREAGTLEGANNQQLMTLMNEYRPELAKELGFKGSRFSDQVAIYDPDLAVLKQPQQNGLPMDIDSRMDRARNLYKATNITEGGLEKAEELGGLAVPSLAVAKTDAPFESFGEISLVGEKGSFLKDPTFNADVYSPRFPRATNKVDRGAVEKEVGRLKGEVDPRIDDRIERDFSPERLAEDLDRLGYSVANRQSYLQSIGKGVNPDDYTKMPEPYEIPKWYSDLGLTTDSLYTLKDFGNPEFTSKAEKFLLDLDPKKGIEDWWDGGELTRSGKMTALKSFREVRNKANDTEPKFDNLSMQKEVQRRIDENKEGFSDYLSKQKSKISNGKFFEVWNPKTATTKRFDYNLKNAVKIMKGNIRGGEGFKYGNTGLLRSAVAPQLKTLQDITNRRGQIVTDSDMNLVKEELDSGLDNLYDELYNKWAWGEEPDRSTFVEGLMNAAKGDLSDFKNLTDADQQMIGDFLNELKEAPTHYFEIKPQRAVDISEFYGAAVPVGTPKKLVKQLEQKGLKVEQYEPEKRVDAIKRLDKLSGGKILFSGAGAVVLYNTVKDDKDERFQ